MDFDFDLRKIVHVRKNGDFDGAPKKVAIDQSWDLHAFVKSTGPTVGLAAAAFAFNCDGVLIGDIDEIAENEVVVLSERKTWLPDPAFSDDAYEDLGGIPSVIGNYAVGDAVGRGTFGEVRVGTHRTTKDQVALKFAKKTARVLTLDGAVYAADVVGTLLALKHAHVVQVLAREEHAKFLVLACELLAGGDLRGHLVARGPSVDDAALAPTEAKLVMRQLLSAVSFAHSKKILHRDLKLENVFLVRLGALDTVKIGDFGLCDLFSVTGGQRLDGLGTEYILPPEAFDDNASLGPHFDVWALGVLLFTLLSGRLPFGKSGYNLGGEEESHVPEAAVTKSKIKAGVYKLPSGVDPLAADLLRWMLAMKPGDRATVTQVLNHPWTTDMESGGNACMCPLPALPDPAEVDGGPRRMSRGGSSMQSEQSPSKTTLTTGPSTATATAVSEKSRVASVGLDALDRSIHEYSPRPGLDRSVHGQHQTTSSRRLSVGKDSLDQSIHEHAIDRTSNSSSTTIATTTVGDGGAGAAAALVVTGKLRRKASTVDAMEAEEDMFQRLADAAMKNGKKLTYAGMASLSNSVHATDGERRGSAAEFMSSRSEHPVSERTKASYMEGTRASNTKIPDKYLK